MKRILIAKPGLDGHDRGAKVVARALKDAGYEVIYTGIRQTPEMIVSAAVQENADAIGLSILSGAHKVLLPEIVKLLKERLGEKEAKKILVFAGGIIPREDVRYLKSKGVSEVFPPGTLTRDITEFLKKRLK